MVEGLSACHEADALTICTTSARIIEVIQQQTGSVPTRGPVAQLGARFHGMEEVVGSIPTRSTKSSRKIEVLGRLLAGPGYFTHPGAITPEQPHYRKESSTKEPLAREIHSGRLTARLGRGPECHRPPHPDSLDWL